MNLKEAERKLGTNKEFKIFLDTNKDAFLCACILIEENWQFDYYSRKNKRLVSFLVGDKDIANKDIELINNEEERLKEVKLNKIKINVKEALKLVDGVFNEKLKGENVNQKLIILQNIDDKIIWNITYIISGFRFLNLRIDAITGEVLKETIDKIII